MTDPSLPFLRAITRSHARASLALVLACLCLFLPGFFSLQPMDRDEPRFAQASKQMIETGDYVAIRFQDEARNKKPVGIYWLQAGFVRAAEVLGVPDARTSIWLYRMPSLLGATGAVLLTYWAALVFATPANAALAALLLASTFLLGAEARLAKTDAVVTFTVVAAMGALARRFLAGEKCFANAAIFWSAIAVGILVKGPVTPMVPAFAALALSIHQRSARWLLPLRPMAGLAWCVVIAAPWLVLIYIKTNGAFFSDAIGGDMLGKVAGAKEQHGAPPLTYFAAFWLTAWPMAPFAALAFPWVRRNWRAPAVLFLMSWLAPGWLLFELVPTKLPHYVLPLYPAIAIAIAMAFEQGALNVAARWKRAVLWLAPAVSVLVPVAALGLSFWFKTAIAWQFVPAAGAALALAVFAVRALLARDTARLMQLGPVLAFAVALVAWSSVLTTAAFEPFAISPRLAQARANAIAASAGACPALAPATAGYREPSLVFLTATSLFMTAGAGAAEFLAAGPCRIAFVDKAQEGAFTEALNPFLPVLKPPRISGVNLNGGKTLDIGVYVRLDQRP